MDHLVTTVACELWLGGSPTIASGAGQNLGCCTIIETPPAANRIDPSGGSFALLKVSFGSKRRPQFGRKKKLDASCVGSK